MLFRVFNTAWRRAAGFLTGGMFASARMEQRHQSLPLKADRLTASDDRLAGLPMGALTNRAYGQAGFWLLLISLMMLPLAGHAVPAGTLIENTATANFNGGTTTDSNTVSTVTVIVRTAATLEFLQYAPNSGTSQPVSVSTTDYSTSGTAAGPFLPMAAPTPAGSSTAIDLSTPVSLEPVSIFHQGDPVFIRLTDLDQNLDTTTSETVVITLSVSPNGDSELLRLRETGPDTGVFVGYIQSYVASRNPTAITPANGQLGLQEDASLSARYADVIDGTDTASFSALVDPFGLLFDSSTGQPVSGADVTLIDASTSLPATVYGDDGISSFPATITTGASATDSSGTVYNFAAGEYRFPYVPPGNYRLQVTPPANYAAPSVVATSVLQSLPGAPFAIDAFASRGLNFTIDPGPAIRVDIPLDPDDSGFFLVKQANKQLASIGDFLQYRLGLTNNSGAVASNSRIVDTLPAGLRYQPGSSKYNGNPIADPAISNDGRTLTFNLGELADKATGEVSYVVEVSSGTHIGDVINRAVASANGGALNSNQGSASVRIKQDLLRNNSVLMGRVIADDCDATDTDIDKGIAGVRIYLENGTYAVTDEQGMYHIEGVKPGDHVVQLDLDSLHPQYEPVICDEHTRFAGTAFSRFVDLQGGSLWRTDFHLRKRPPPSAEVELLLNNQVDAHRVTYHLEMRGGDVALDNLRLMVSLPQNTHYIAGSSVMNNRLIGDPEIRGPVLIYSLGKVDGNWDKQLNFLTEVEAKGETAIMPSKAFLMFNTPSASNQRTPMVETVMKRIRHEKELKGEVGPRFTLSSAELSDEDKTELKQLATHLRDHKVVHIEVTGHTDNIPIGPRTAQRYATNLALSVARARSVGEYLTHLLQLPESALVVNGMGARQPYLSNQTEQGRTKNRRVELRIVTETMLDASQLTDITSVSNIGVEVEGEWKATPPPTRKTSTDDVRQLTMPDYNQSWIETAQPGAQLLWPPENYTPPIPSIRLAVKHAPSQQLTVLLNGEPLSALNFDRQFTNRSNTVALSRWGGIDINKGHNQLLIELRDANGLLLESIQRDVSFTSLPVRAELVPEQSRLIADGKQPPLIAFRLLDKDNRPIREGLVGEFMLAPPHTAQLDLDDLRHQPLTGLDRGRTRYRVGKDGIALIELKPTTQSGEVSLILPLQNHEQTLRPWLEAAQRDWILVGLASGTVAHNTVSGNLESLSAADLEQGTYTDGKLSFFARGSIKGEWLLTLAYDSDRTEEERNTLFQQIDPDSYFPVYGDGTAQGYDASSREKLYVRLERKQFYALFGDYQTGLTVTELSRYERSLTGFKSEFRGEQFALNVFASETGQNFVKDEIRGEGTSGLYRLRYSQLVFNSDKVRIETRDRFRPQLVLSSQPLTRHIDYNIDYDAGTLYFKQPVASKDASFNPIYIVVDYETRSTGAEQMSWGGRGATRLLDNKLELGATFIQQGQANGDDTLKGVDATYVVDDNTQLKLEYASSKQVGTESEDALLAELQHTSSQLEGSLFYRKQQAGFGLGQQSLIGSGTTSFGVEGLYHLDDQFDIRAEAFRQTNLQTRAERDVIETAIQYDANHYGATAGLRSASDRYTSGASNDSQQLTLGAHRSFFDHRLTLRASHDQSLSDNANPDYPTRTLLGADYLLSSSTSLFMEQEFTFGDNQDSRGTRIGFSNRPWSGATLTTSLEQQSSDNSQRLFANAGLKQSWKINDAWSMDAAIDSSSTLRDPGDLSFSASLPPASGNTEDFTAVSLGANYTHNAWSWTSRIEQRNAMSEDKWGIYSATAGELYKGLALSARLQWFETENDSGVDGTHGDLRLGLVNRPFERQWTLLNRSDFVVDSQSGSTSDFDNWKLVNNLLANYRALSYQLSLYYGAKYARDTIDNTNYSAYTDSIGIEARHDLNQRWDIGTRLSTLHSWNSDVYEYAYGLSVGFSPAQNIWLTTGYNFAGYEDNDFDLAGYSAKGLYLKLRIKFDQNSIRDIASWFNRQ